MGNSKNKFFLIVVYIISWFLLLGFMQFLMETNCEIGALLTIIGIPFYIGAVILHIVLLIKIIKQYKKETLLISVIILSLAIYSYPFLFMTAKGPCYATRNHTYNIFHQKIEQNNY